MDADGGILPVQGTPDETRCASVAIQAIAGTAAFLRQVAERIERINHAQWTRTQLLYTKTMPSWAAWDWRAEVGSAHDRPTGLEKKSGIAMPAGER